MQTIGAYLGDRLGLTIALCVLAAIFLIVILTVLYRLMFGRRLHMAGARSRQPRLGVVDAFDLDKQRQLVLIRRDNVEHLLMIGGPNDLVIESAFQRAQPTLAVPAGRDKEGVLSSAAVVPMPLIPSRPEAGSNEPDMRAQNGSALASGGDDGRLAPPPLELKDAVSPADLGPLADIPAPGPVSAPPIPPSDAATPEAAAAAPLRPFTSRLSQPPLPRSGIPLRPPLSAPRAPLPVQRPPSLLPNRPMPLTPLQRGTSAASLRRDPPAPAPTPAPEVSVTPSPEGAAPGEAEAPAVSGPVAPAEGTAVAVVKPAPALPLTLESIESLEEEMAKLLGRGASDKT